MPSTASQRVQLQNEQYKHELALLKRHRFARKSEVLNAHQRSLLDDLVDEDLAGIEEEMQHQSTPQPRARVQTTTQAQAVATGVAPNRY